MRAGGARGKAAEERARERTVGATRIQIRPHRDRRRVAVRVRWARLVLQGPHDNYLLVVLEQQVLIRDRLQGFHVRGRVRQIELSSGHLHGDGGAHRRRGAVAAPLRAGVVGRDGHRHRILGLARIIPHRLDDLRIIDDGPAVLRPGGQAPQGGRKVACRQRLIEQADVRRGRGRVGPDLRGAHVYTRNGLLAARRVGRAADPGERLGHRLTRVRREGGIGVREDAPCRRAGIGGGEHAGAPMG